MPVLAASSVSSRSAGPFWPTSSVSSRSAGFFRGGQLDFYRLDSEVHGRGHRECGPPYVFVGRSTRRLARLRPAERTRSRPPRDDRRPR
jgi:hypothetical protein